MINARVQRLEQRGEERAVLAAQSHLQPPFDNPKARLALLHTVDQTAILQAIGAPAENARPFCGSFFMCGTPMETKAGAAGLAKPDFDKARALLKEANCDGRPVVFLQPSDLSANVNATVVVADGMRKAVFKVDVQPLDWGTVSPRRNNKARSTRQQGRLEPVHHRRHRPRCLDAAHQRLPRHPVPQRHRRLPLRRGAPAPTPTNVSGLRQSTVPVFWEVVKEG